MTASARTIALVACSARKLDRRAKARDLYTGALFRASVRFAEAHGWPWFVLSAKHWVVHPDTPLDPYDVALGRLRHRTDVHVGACTERELASQWRVHVRMRLMCGDAPLLRPGDAVVMLAGAVYRDAGNLCEVLRGCGIRVEVPLAGMGIGSQKRWLRLHTPEPKG